MTLTPLPGWTWKPTDTLDWSYNHTAHVVVGLDSDDPNVDRLLLAVAGQRCRWVVPTDGTLIPPGPQ